jgi:hypothetical protein
MAFMCCAVCFREEELEALIWVMVPRFNEPDHGYSKDE